MRGWIATTAVLALVGCSEQRFSEKKPLDLSVHEIPLEPERVTDLHVQTSPTQADVLFVISNWWSAEQAYAELEDRFDEMLDVFIGSGVDFHIGVISTDTDHWDDRGKLKEVGGVRWIDEETANPVDVFVEMATMSASGCVGPRRPRDATFLALEHEVEDWNLGFRREPASLHTVFVNDDRDTSVMLSFDEWVEWYEAYTQTPELDTLSTIVDTAKDSQNVVATSIIGGTTHEIFDMPWTNVLDEIGLRAQGMQREFFLSRIPDAGTIAVTVDNDGFELSFTEGPEDEGGDWLYDAIRNSVRFHEYQPPEGARISIDYVAL